MAEGSASKGVNRGLLWGCILPVIAVALIAAGWLTYNTYYYTSGYKEAPGLPDVMTAVRASPTAARVLGSNIQIVRLEFNMPSNARQNGHRITYIVRVRGSMAEGKVQSSVLIETSGTRITSLALMGPDETPHNLLKEP
jgi:hypothetical protein